MIRKPGPIPPIKSNRLPKRLIIFDTEATRTGFTQGVEKQKLKLGVAHFINLVDGYQVKEDEWTNFTCLLHLVSFIEDKALKDKCLYLYAHNLKYDIQLTGLLTCLIDRGWKTTLFVAEDPPTFVRLRKGRKSIMLVDTFNYWSYSLERMGLQLGLPKLKMPTDNDDNATWFTYCKRDVEVLGQYLLSFIRFLLENDLSPLGLTVASQAFRAFRHRFMSYEIIIHNDEKVLELERQAYSGGRVEAFYIGKLQSQDLYKLDVNSMYPYVMLNQEYPVKLVAYGEGVSLDRVKHLTKDYYLVAECELETLDPLYPCKEKGKLIFPVGQFTTTLHLPEINYALEHGHLKGVSKLAVYEKAPLFTDYVTFFYDLKVQAELNDNQVLRQQAKLFLNALYGKFGQREVYSKIVDNQGPKQYKRVTGFSHELNKWVEVNYLGNRIELRYSEGESTYSFPAIAGAVTAYARVYLWDLVRTARVENVLYCDTDSLIVTLQGYDNLSAWLDPVSLGMLKVEGQAKDLVIHGLKDYVFGGEVKHKGLPKSAVQVGINTWSYEQFRGFKTWLHEGLPVGVEVYQRTKKRVGTYDKGIIDPTGKVSPLRFDRG